MGAAFRIGAQVILSLIPQPYRAAAKLGAYVVAVVGLLGVGAYIGSRNEAARHAKTIAVYANATAKAEADAHAAALRIRETEAASAARLAEIDADHLEAIEHARTETRDAVLRDLRTRRLALRLPVRACPPLVPAGSDPAASAGERDADTDDGSRDALAVAVAEQIGIAAQADATLSACQATVREYIRLTAEAAQARETGSRKPEGRSND